LLDDKGATVAPWRKLAQRPGPLEGRRARPFPAAFAIVPGGRRKRRRPWRALAAPGWSDGSRASCGGLAVRPRQQDGRNWHPVSRPGHQAKVGRRTGLARLTGRDILVISPTALGTQCP